MDYVAEGDAESITYEFYINDVSEFSKRTLEFLEDNKLEPVVAETSINITVLRGEKDVEFRKIISNFRRSRSLKKKLVSQSAGKYTGKDIEEIYKTQNGLCYYTGKKLTWKPRNFSIDHITPVDSYGSSWPGNIALCLKEINRDKLTLNKQQYFKVLSKTLGPVWVKGQLNICREIDKKRRVIDKLRKKTVEANFNNIEDRLNNEFRDHEIRYRMEGYVDVFESKYPFLTIDSNSVRFSAGFVRDKRYKDYEYIRRIVLSILL